MNLKMINNAAKTFTLYTTEEIPFKFMSMVVYETRDCYEWSILKIETFNFLSRKKMVYNVRLEELKFFQDFSTFSLLF